MAIPQPSGVKTPAAADRQVRRPAVHIAAIDRIGDFVGFFYGVGRNRLERLHAVPFASANRIAKPLHNIYQSFQAHLVSQGMGKAFCLTGGLNL
jgi:hypothetical protein